MSRELCNMLIAQLTSHDSMMFTTSRTNDSRTLHSLQSIGSNCSVDCTTRWSFTSAVGRCNVHRGFVVFLGEAISCESSLGHQYWRKIDPYRDMEQFTEHDVYQWRDLRNQHVIQLTSHDVHDLRELGKQHSAELTVHDFHHFRGLRNKHYGIGSNCGVDCNTWWSFSSGVE